MNHTSQHSSLYDRFSKILDEKEYWAFVSQMAEIIQPEGVDMFHMDLEHIHSVLRNQSYDMESLMRQVSAEDVISLVHRRNRPIVMYNMQVHFHSIQI